MLKYLCIVGLIVGILIYQLYFYKYVNKEISYHDSMAKTTFDYCPTITGHKCGRPGCH